MTIWAGFNFHSEVHSYTWRPSLASPQTCTGCWGQRAKQEPGFLRVWSVWCTLLFHSGGSNSPISSTAEHWRWGDLSNAVPFQRGLVHAKLCEYLRCPACFCSLCQTAAVLPAPSMQLRAPATTGIWELTPLFQALVATKDAKNFRVYVSLLSLPLNMPSVS